MKSGTPAHPKTEQLMGVLQVDRAKACGTLELLWHFTREYAPRGDIGKYPDERIATACAWAGGASILVAALVSCGWLDKSKRYRLVVHHWSDHADDGVHCLLARKLSCFAEGTAPKLNRLNREDRNRLEPLWKEHLTRVPCACHAHQTRIPARSRTLPSVALPSPLLPTALVDPDGSPGGGIGGSEPVPFFDPNSPESIASGYVGVFNAAFSRSCSVTAGVRKKIRGRLADWRAWQLVAQPLLVFANCTDQDYRDAIVPEWCLRDGAHPRTSRAGNVNGGTDWLEREYNRADRTVLDERLAAIARDAGVLDKLQSIGVQVRGVA